MGKLLIEVDLRVLRDGGLRFLSDLTVLRVFGEAEFVPDELKHCAKRVTKHRVVGGDASVCVYVCTRVRVYACSQHLVLGGVGANV
jgi:hypothetical protein